MLDGTFQACCLEFGVIEFLKGKKNGAKAIGKVTLHVGIAIEKISSCKHAKTGTSTYMGMAVSYKIYVTAKFDQS